MIILDSFAVSILDSTGFFLANFGFLLDYFAVCIIFGEIVSFCFSELCKIAKPPSICSNFTKRPWFSGAFVVILFSFCGLKMLGGKQGSAHPCKNVPTNGCSAGSRHPHAIVHFDFGRTVPVSCRRTGEMHG